MYKKSIMRRKIWFVSFLILMLIGISGCASMLVQEDPDKTYKVFTNKMDYETFRAAAKADIGDITMSSATWKGWYLNEDEFAMWKQKVRVGLKENSFTRSEIRNHFSKDGFSDNPLNTAVNVITRKEHGVIIQRSGNFLLVTLR